MKRIVLLLLAVGALLLVGGRPGVSEEPSPDPRLELTLARKPHVVHPVPDPRDIERAAEQAIAEIQARERAEELVRETLRGPSRRPDLSYDVWSGIQSRNLNEALRRR